LDVEKAISLAAEISRAQSACAMW